MCGYSGLINVLFVVRQIALFKFYNVQYNGNQRDGRTDKTFGFNAGRSGVQIPGRGKRSLRTIAADARVKYPLYIMGFSYLTI